MQDYFRNFPYFVGPMVGLSHIGVRELIRSYTPPGIEPVIFTEMLSSRRLPSETLNKGHEVCFSTAEAGSFVPQLLGNEESYIRASIEKLLPMQPWGIDINMGCPVKRTLRHNWGFRLVGQPDYAAAIVEATRRATPADLPVSVKLRGDLSAVNPDSERKGSNFEQETEYLLRFTQVLEAAGADWLTIHPRAARDQHKGTANWELVASVCQKMRIPVVVNGDIQTAEDARTVIEQHGCDGAMIGRAVTARPWIFWQIAESHGSTAAKRFGTAPRYGAEEGEEYPRAVLRLIDILSRLFPKDERYVIERVCFFVAMGSKWYQFGHDFWKRTTRAKNLIEMREIILGYAERFANPSVARVKFL